MSKRYIILAIILIGVAFALNFLPKKSDSKQIDPSSFLIMINDQSRFLETDMIARRLIDADPSLLLIDVRTLYDYEDYALPGAINIPIEELLLSQWKDYLNQKSLDVVFYSNGDVFADQAWALCAQRGYKNLYVMKGGLNEWFRTIMLPEYPPEEASSEDFDLYTFRKGASLFFGGSAPEIPVITEEVTEVQKEAPKKTVVVKKKVKKAAEGGC